MRRTSSAYDCRLLFSYCLIACTPQSTPETTPDLRSAPAELVRIADEVKDTNTHMGMPFTITLKTKRSRADTQRDLRAAFQAIAAVESRMSEWQPTSEISRINQVAGKGGITVSDETFQVVRFAHNLAKASAGAFDPTWAAFRGLWQFKTPPFEVPSKTRIDQALHLVDYRAILLEHKSHHIALKRQGMQLGLGGIAKGFGIDAAADLLKKKGYEHFLIDGGGDVYAAGRKDHKTPWRIGVRHPRESDRYIGYLSPEDMAVVTSGDYEHFFEKDQERYHHIIDVRNGYPARNSVSVTVVSPKTMHADAIATAVFVLGPQAGIVLAKQYEKTQVLILSPDGRVHTYPETMKTRFPATW